MAARKDYTKITAGVFSAARLLLQNGLSADKCAKAMNIGIATVYRIKASGTYEEYKDKANAYYFRHKKQKSETKASEAIAEERPEAKPEEKPGVVTGVVEHRQTVIVQATSYMMEEMKRQTELLKVISAKLLWIVEQLS